MRFGNLLECEIKPNHDTIQIAYQAWVEIITRKVGLPFDDEHDVVAAVYDSWYALFGVLRGLSKEVPAHRLRADEDTRALIVVLHRVLNEGLRPHLTRWQARFRRWYTAEIEAERNLHRTPQEVQRDFPEYEALTSDLRRVNAAFIEFSGALRSIAYGEVSQTPPVEMAAGRS